MNSDGILTTRTFSKFVHPFVEEVEKTFGERAHTLKTLALHGCSEPGLSRNVTDKIKLPDGTLHTLNTTGVLMLSRAGILSFIKLKYRDKKISRFALLLLDIERFRDADLAGNGDYHIGEICKKIMQVAEKINPENLMNAIPARIGGDEIVILFPTTKKLLEYRERFENTVKSVYGYYKEPDGSLIYRQASLKMIDDSKAVITLPKDPSKRALFWKGIETGKLFDEEQLEKIGNPKNISVVKSTPFTTRTRFKGYKFIYSHLENLLQDSPKLKPAKWFLGLNTFISEVMFDGLLGDNVKNMTILMNEQVQEGYTWQMHIDTQFIKEINDKWNQADGDKVIKATWERIKTILGKKLGNPEISVSRQGSSFWIHTKNENVLGSKTLGSLEKILEVPVDLDGEKYKIPVGISVINHEDTPWTPQEFREVIGKGRREAKKDFLVKKLLKNSKKDASYFILDSKENMDEENVIQKGNKPLERERWLMLLFLYGKKREQERREYFLEALEELLKASSTKGYEIGKKQRKNLEEIKKYVIGRSKESAKVSTGTNQ